MTHIHDAAVQAPERIRVAQDAEGFWTCREAITGSQEYVRADLAEASLSAPCAVDVKNLEWFVKANGDIVSDSAFGWYRLHMVVVNSCFRLETPDGIIKYKTPYSYWPEKEAKAAAQDDFERRVCECIFAKPIDVAAVRKQAFEEAARVVATKPMRFAGQTEKTVRDTIASAIRALSAEAA